MNTIGQRARRFFDTTPHAYHVTFDDGQHWRRNLPWVRYAGAWWGYADPDTIRVEIDEWMILIHGHKLAPLFEAIEEQTLKSVGVHPEWKNDAQYELHTFATEIRFVRLSSLAPVSKRRPADQLKFDLFSNQQHETR